MQSFVLAVKSALTILLLTAVLLIAVEALARVALPYPIGTRGTYISAQDVLFFHRPNSKGYEISTDGDFTPNLVRYDGDGFRDPRPEIRDQRSEIRDQRSEIRDQRSEIRVAIVGDSFVEARQVSFSTSVTGVLSDKFPKFDFINAGCSAWTTTNYFLLLKHRLLQPPQRFNRLVIFFSFNDYSDNFIYKGGYFRYPEIFDNDALPPIELMPVDYSVDSFKSFASSLTERSALVANLARLFKSKSASQLAVPIEKDSFQDSFRGVNIPDHLLDPTGKEVLQFTHRGLAEIATLAKKFEIPLTVFIMPLPMQVAGYEWSLGKSRYYGYQVDYIERSTVYQSRLLGFCKQADIECVDLLPDFRSASQQDRPLFFPYDGHLTEAGHAVAANVVAHHLRGGLD